MMSFAVSLGRIEEGNKYMREGIDEVKKTTNGISETVASHSVAIAALQVRSTAQDKILAERAPQKAPWPSIGAFIIAGGGFAWMIADKILTQ
jgi:hypothetical protein